MSLYLPDLLADQILLQLEALKISPGPIILVSYYLLFGFIHETFHTVLNLNYEHLMLNQFISVLIIIAILL